MKAYLGQAMQVVSANKEKIIKGVGIGVIGGAVLTALKVAGDQYEDDFLEDDCLEDFDEEEDFEDEEAEEE